jgi:hypothetical protein
MLLALIEPGVLAGADGDKLTREWHRSLKGGMANNPGVSVFGPIGEECVRFEPEGVRIGVPDFDNDRGNGVLTDFGIKGDFEITVSYEILREPEVEQAGPRQTRISLGVDIDREGFNMATISRKVQGKRGREFMGWVTLFNKETGKNQAGVNPIPARTRVGRLRLVRTGDTLVFYGSETLDGNFIHVWSQPIGGDDIRTIRLAAATGNPEVPLDVRVSDLHIRAEGFINEPAVASTPGAGPEPEKKSRLVMWLVLGAVLVLALLGGWLYVRRRGQRGEDRSFATLREE